MTYTLETVYNLRAKCNIMPCAQDSMKKVSQKLDLFLVWIDKVQTTNLLWKSQHQKSKWFQFVSVYSLRDEAFHCAKHGILLWRVCIRIKCIQHIYIDCVSLSESEKEDSSCGLLKYTSLGVITSWLANKNTGFIVNKYININ